jgi:NAD(P)-dependent dehydrogenase (short-subunit alcohol dehydrogenase family)
VTADVRDQKTLFKTVEEIATKEGRMDICVAAAGISGAARSCLEYTEEELEEVCRRSVCDRKNIVQLWERFML